MDGDDDKIQVDFAQQKSELNDQVSIQKEKKKKKTYFLIQFPEIDNFQIQRFFD